jgi:nucleoside-diphosphate-sugar epimerase
MSKSIQRVLIVGCGYVGSQVAHLLSERDVDVWSLNRTPKDLPLQIKQLFGDVTDFNSLPQLDQNFDGVVYAVSPLNRTEESYRSAYYTGLENVMNKIGRASNPKGLPLAHSEIPVRLLLVSSTGVFGQNEGEWVGEETDPNPTNERALQLLRTERLAIELGNPGIVLRLSGIYGPGRIQTIKKILGGEYTYPETNHYTNRIHRDDSARSICHLLDLPAPKGLYLGVDCDPAPLHTVYNWIATRTGRPDPCPNMTKTFFQNRNTPQTNKRCRNQRLVESGFSFMYPTFREGYEPLIRQEETRCKRV